MYIDHNKEALGGLISKMTQEGMADQSQVKRIPVEQLVDNPKNFYHVRDIDKLAGFIAVSHHVDPLVVMPQDDGTYMIISGHRRTAAWKILLERGTVSDHTLPCFVWQFKELHILQDGGEDIVLPADTAMTIFFIAMNAGQRERSIDEKLEEIRRMEAIARVLYRQLKKSGTMSKGFLFRDFFAKNFLNISSSALQRRLSLLRLTERAKQALNENLLAETSASLLVQMTPEDQDAYIDGLRAGRYNGTNAEITALLHPETKPQLPGVNPGAIMEPQKNKMVIAFDKPKYTDNPQEEAQHWFQGIIEGILAHAKIAQADAESAGDHLVALQWNVRIALAKVQLEMLS